MTRSAPAFTKRYAMNVKRYRDALRDAVELPIATRGVLYVLAQWMNTDGTNARPSLSRLSASCQLRQRAVAKHLAEGVKAGYLHRASGGHRGRTAVYQACVPDYRWDPNACKLVQPLEVSEPEVNPRERQHDGAGYDEKGCTDGLERVQENDTKACTVVQPDLGNKNLASTA